MSFSKKGLAIGIIIGVIVGLVSGYTVTSMETAKLVERISDLEGQITNLENEIANKNTLITNLQSQVGEGKNQIANLQSKLAKADEDLENLQGEYLNLQSEASKLQSEVGRLEQLHNEVLQDYQELNESYTLLLNTLNIIDAKNLSRTEEFELNIGETLRRQYDVGYGIIWIVEISLAAHGGTRFGCHIGWRQGEQGAEVSGGWVTIQQSIPSINGTISTEIFDEGDALFIRTNVDTNVLVFNRDGCARLLKA